MNTSEHPSSVPAPLPEHGIADDLTPRPIGYLSPSEAERARGGLHSGRVAVITGPETAEPRVAVYLEASECIACAAPLVPSPAYGGVREALEPFEKAAEVFADEREWRDHDTITFAPLENLREVQYLTVGDLRRARAAYDALSPVAVEEVDAKAVDIELNTPDFSLSCDEGGWAYAYRRGDAFVPGEFDMNEEPGKAFRELADALSTPSPQIGKAGAGPVRDATDAMIEAGLKVDMTNEDEVAFLHNVWHAMVAAHPAGAGPVGEAVALLDPDHRKGPPQPLLHPNAEWCEAYARWFHV